jgi:NADH dehydrogenase
MNVFITGIGSFVGSFLSSHLRVRHHTVSGSARAAVSGKNIHRLVLGEPCPAGIFNDQDVVIHCAWDIHSTSQSFNTDATRLVVEAARQSGVARQIFLSSLSASPNALTVYGQGKYLAENLFDHNEGDIVIRPGLIVGDGGLFRRTFEFVRQKPIIPLIGGGRLQIPLVGYPQLAESIARMLVTPFPFPRPCLLFHPSIPSQRELIRAICAQRKWRRLLLPVPARLAMGMLWIAERFSQRLPIKSSNLRAALQNHHQPGDSDLAFVLGTSQPVSEILSLIAALP